MNSLHPKDEGAKVEKAQTQTTGPPTVPSFLPA